IPEPGADREAAQRLEPLVGQRPGDLDPEQGAGNAGIPAVGVEAARPVAARDLDRVPFEGPERVAMIAQVDDVRRGIERRLDLPVQILIAHGIHLSRARDSSPAKASLPPRRRRVRRSLFLLFVAAAPSGAARSRTRPNWSGAMCARGPRSSSSNLRKAGSHQTKV